MLLLWTFIILPHEGEKWENVRKYVCFWWQNYKAHGLYVKFTEGKPCLQDEIVRVDISWVFTSTWCVPSVNPQIKAFTYASFVWMENGWKMDLFLHFPQIYTLSFHLTPNLISSYEPHMMVLMGPFWWKCPLDSDIGHPHQHAIESLAVSWSPSRDNGFPELIFSRCEESQAMVESGWAPSRTLLSGAVCVSVCSQ